MIPSASRGRAPPFSVDCSRKRSAISETERPPTLVVPAIDIRSVTSASAALRSEPASAASTPFIFVAAGAGREREPLDILRQADLAVEILDQPPPPDRVEIERIDQRGEQRDVAGADFDLGQAECAGRLQRQRQHLGVGGGAILPSEGFDAGLQEFARPAAAIAEHRAEIAEARRLAGAAGGEIVPRHRNGEIGTKAQFLAAGVGGQIEALADVLAGEVEERLGRLQDRRLGPGVAGLRERQ